MSTDRPFEGDLRVRASKAFYDWGLWISGHARAVIASCLALILGLASFLPGLTTDFSLEGYLHPDDPTRLLYNEYRHQFDRGDSIMIGIETPDVFEVEFLEKLRAFHEELEAESPHVEEIVSLINARWTHGDEDTLIVEDQLEDWPETKAELEELRARIMANPLFPGRLIAREADLTTLTIRPEVYSSRGEEDFALDGFDEAPESSTVEFLSDAEVQELVAVIQEIARGHDSPDFRTYVVGPSVIATHMTVVSVRDTMRTTTLSLSFLSALLYLLFRRISGVLLTLTVISASAVAGVSCMVPLGVAFSSMSQFLPTLLLAVGACDAIHILAIFYRRLDAGSEPHIAIAESLEHSGLAVVMTSLTTAAGLLCFLGASLLPVSELGKIAPLGIGMALFFTLTLLPACLAVWPHRMSARTRNSSTLRDLLLRTGEFGMNHRRAVLAGTFVVSAVSLFGASQTRLGLDTIRWIPEDDPVRLAVEAIDEKLAGVGSLELLIDTDEEHGLKDPSTLARLELASRALETIEVNGIRAGTPFSVVDIVKETHRALNANSDAHYTVPEDRQIVAQELLLFSNSGPEELERVVTPDYKRARMSFMTPNADAMLIPDFLDEIERVLGEIFGEEIRLSITGAAALSARTFQHVLKSLLTSYSLALLMIVPMLIFMVGSFRLGLVAMIPNLLPVLVVLGYMGWVDMAINPITILAGTVIIGLAVDDTIHFMNGWTRYRSAGSSTRQAVRKTLSTTGIALLITSISLGGCFLTYLGAWMTAMAGLGKILALGIAVALVADILVAPALLTWVESDDALATVPADEASEGARQVMAGS